MSDHVESTFGYMFIGLVLSSLGFLVPAWIAKKKGKHITACSYKCIALTSVLYHGTQHALAHVIDKLVVHAFSIFHLCRATASALRDKSIAKVGCIVTSCIPVYIYFGKSLRTEGMESKYWHMLFHITGQGVLTIYAWHF